MSPTCSNLIHTLDLITAETVKLTEHLTRKHHGLTIFLKPSAPLQQKCLDSLSKLEIILRKLRLNLSTHTGSSPLPDLLIDMDNCLDEFSALSTLLSRLPPLFAGSNRKRLRRLMKKAETHINELLGYTRDEDPIGSSCADPDDAGFRDPLDENGFGQDFNTVFENIPKKIGTPDGPAASPGTFAEFNACHRLSPLTIPQEESASPPSLDTLELTAISPASVRPGEYGIVDIVLFQKEYRHIIDEIIQEQLNRKKTAGGVHQAARGTAITVSLTSPDVAIEEPEETQIWQGSYLRFSIDFSVPQDYAKSQILLRALVSFNSIPATRLRILVNLGRHAGVPHSIERLDIRSAFVSYSSKDMRDVYLQAQVIRTCLPNIDLFVDRSCLKPGEFWEECLFHEIDSRDMLFLFWSRAAKESPYVEKEWRYALEKKGIEGICPLPLESPKLCPPPEALNRLHFGSPLLYLIQEAEHK